MTDVTRTPAEARARQVLRWLEQTRPPWLAPAHLDALAAVLRLAEAAAPLADQVRSLAAACDELRERLRAAEAAANTLCCGSGCGWQVALAHPDARALLARHVESCPQHPLAKLRGRLVAARGEIAVLCRALSALLAVPDDDEARRGAVAALDASTGAKAAAVLQAAHAAVQGEGVLSVEEWQRLCRAVEALEGEAGGG